MLLKQNKVKIKDCKIKEIRPNERLSSGLDLLVGIVFFPSIHNKISGHES